MESAFEIYNSRYSQAVARIWMDESLIKDPSIVDQNNLTLSPIKNGGQYTLVPLESAHVETVRDLKKAHKQLMQPPEGFSHYTANIDCLIAVVNRLLSNIEYTHVTCRDDIYAIINPWDADDREMDTIEIAVLTNEIIKKPIDDCETTKTDDS